MIGAAFYTISCIIKAYSDGRIKKNFCFVGVVSDFNKSYKEKLQYERKKDVNNNVGEY